MYVNPGDRADRRQQPPDVRVLIYTSAALNVTNNLQTNITFNSEYYDTAEMHSIVTNTERITFPFNGLYVIGATWQYNANATGYRYTAIDVNGNATPTSTLLLDSRTGVNADISAGSFQCDYEFKTGDYAVLSGYQNSGGTRTFQARYWARLLRLYD